MSANAKHTYPMICHAALGGERTVAVEIQEGFEAPPTVEHTGMRSSWPLLTRLPMCLESTCTKQAEQCSYRMFAKVVVDDD
jgi:hypothetical protein